MPTRRKAIQSKQVRLKSQWPYTWKRWQSAFSQLAFLFSIQYFLPWQQKAKTNGKGKLCYPFNASQSPPRFTGTQLASYLLRQHRKNHKKKRRKSVYTFAYLYSLLLQSDNSLNILVEREVLDSFGQWRTSMDSSAAIDWFYGPLWGICECESI